MIRRARLSFKPNVRPGGRSVGGSAARNEGSLSQPEEPSQPGDNTGLEERDGGGVSSLGVSGEAQGGPDIPEKTDVATTSLKEPSKPAAAPPQRRKRISTLPNLAKPRISSSAPATPSQKPQQVESSAALPVSGVPSKNEVSPPEKAKVQSSPKSQGSNSASQVQQVALPEKRTPIPQVPQFSPHKKASLNQPEINPVKSVDFTQKGEFSPLKERPSQKPSTNGLKKITPKKLVASGNLEKERLRRAQKLRELLKEELRKERKEWKAKHPVIADTGNVERSKMMMRDFIYFIPENNPMTASFSETKSSEKISTESQLSGTPVKNISNDEDDDLDEEDDDSQSLAPRVKVAEDGSIILDEESLTVEVCRNKAPIVEGNDPIFERGSTTTYSSFRKSSYSKPWSDEETDMFFLAISMVGTDFSMIGQLFPHRERIEIKNKFKREERANSWRIDKAFSEKQAFNLEFFSNRLEKALEKAKNKRMMPKLRQPREKKATKPRKKPKDKAAAEVLSDGETAVLSDVEGADARTEEKENESSVSIKECLLPSDNIPGKKKRGRKKKDAKELEEETQESLSEATTALPKKARKSEMFCRAANQVKDSEVAVNDDNLEDVQPAPDTLQEKKKKSRKKKSAEIEAENIGDGDIDLPQGDRVEEKAKNSALPDDADSLMSNEPPEPSFTQSESLTCAEESSLVLFTEESECASEPDEIHSLQESLSVIPESQTLADHNDTFDVLVESSQEDSVFEPSPHLTSASPKDLPLEENMTGNSHTGDKLEGSAESPKEVKESPVRPASFTRSRFQRPRPNIPVRTSARQEKAMISNKDDVNEERNEVTADNSLLQSHQEGSVTENLVNEPMKVTGTESPRKDEVSSLFPKDSSSDFSHIQLGDPNIVSPELTAEKDDQNKQKPSLPIRGCLVRPKPNLKKAPVKEKPPAPKISSPESDFQGSEEISTVPCSIVLTPLCTPVNEETVVQENPSPLKSSTSPEQDTKSTIKPATKPSTDGRISEHKGMEDSEKCDKVSADDATGNLGSKLDSCTQNYAAIGNLEEHGNMSKNEDTCHDATSQDSCEPIKETVSRPCAFVQEDIPKPDRAVSLVSDSNTKGKKPAIKLVKEQLQKLTSSPPKSCDLNETSEMEGDKDTVTENPAEVLEGTMDDGSYLGKPTDIINKALTPDENCGHQESHVRPEEIKQVLSQNPKPEIDVSMSEAVQKPAKPAVLTRGRLQRPKPNLGRALAKRGALSSSDNSRKNTDAEACEKPPDTSQSATNLSQNEGDIDLVKATTEKVPFTENICVLPVESVPLLGVNQVGSEKSLSRMEKEIMCSEDEKKAAPTNPALTGSGFQRPEPNFGRSVTHFPVSAPQKSDVHQEEEIKDDSIKSSSMENLSPCDAVKSPVCANTDTEDTPSPGEITQSYILPLETIVLPVEDQIQNEESVSVSADDSSHATIKKDLSGSEDERKMTPSQPTLALSRFQRPMPNLGRSVARPTVSAVQKSKGEEKGKTKEDSSNDLSIEVSGISREKQILDLAHDSKEMDPFPAEDQNILLGTEESPGCFKEGSAQLGESSYRAVEQVEGSSAKPLRNRFQKPKPNLGRASVKRESKTISSDQEKVSLDSNSQNAEHIENKECPDLTIIKDAAWSIKEESVHTTLKPAQLRRGKLVRPVPNIGKPPNKRLSALQSKTDNEEDTSPVRTDKDLDTSSNKKEVSESLSELSPKRSCLPDTSQSSSDSRLDNVPSDVLEDTKQQHSRFGRPLKRPVSTTPPILTKLSENVTEYPEKEKKPRSVKPVKTQAKPTSSKSKGKTTLVKIRAVNQDEDDDDDDAAKLDYEDYDVSPDKLNQAPVFVPFSLRSPKPVPAEIEETVEELEIPMEDLGFPTSTDHGIGSHYLTLPNSSQYVSVSQEVPNNKVHCDGSTEAAMTLISMGNSVFKSNLEPLDSNQCSEIQLSTNTDCTAETSGLSVEIICASENDTTLNSRPVGNSQKHENGGLSDSSYQQINPFVSDLHTSVQASHPLNVNVTLPEEQTNYPNILEDVQQQDCSMSGHLLEGGGSEETTFILTLVEIPISDGYPYSCEENSADILPAPVLVTSSSSQVLIPEQSSETTTMSTPSSSESCPSGQGETELITSTLSRKRSASISSEKDMLQPCKKVLLCTSAEQEDHRPNTAALEENDKSSSKLVEIKGEKTKESHQHSTDLESSSTGEEKVPQCNSDTVELSTEAHIEEPTTASCNSPSQRLPLSSPRTSQQRPGRKPMGFLSLVCKEKQSKKTKVTSKKSLSKPKCKKAKVQKSEEQKLSRIHEDAPSSEVPSQSSSLSVTSTNTETILSTCQVSETLDTINVSESTEATTQEAPKLPDLTTEDEAATVSEYFFSDIFMEVDE
ncbi:transcription factor TFIIIB component B'' homolog isoform X2 [Pyxicephalus adspersus]|uniref:transcription factor TFIIIB component B'' homolog isoform X2 n=1 Tax=Pyxicephalus adspersus TaxID=30357 RepID=UPI003B5CAF2C